MSEKGSVYQKGGGGTSFEQYVQTAFVTSMLIRCDIPGIPIAEISEVAFQTTNRGYETDDLLITANSSIGQHRILIQIKTNLTFSQDDTTFKEIIGAFWKDYNNVEIFDKSKDKLMVIKSGLNKSERNHLKPLFNWARTHSTETDFFSEVNRIKEKKNVLENFRVTLKKLKQDITDVETWQFIKCLDVLDYDFTNENSVDEVNFLNLIKLSKNSQTTANEKEIWDSILAYVTKLNKDGGSINYQNINSVILNYFDKSNISTYFLAVNKLLKDSKLVIQPLKNNIDDFCLPRNDQKQNIVESINSNQITIITGKPGVGKSAIVKDILTEYYNNSNFLAFRADQFNAPHISTVFSNTGLDISIIDIFSCMALFPHKFIVIDSLEKLLEGDPDSAFKQLLCAIEEYPGIKIIATTRKYAADLLYLKFDLDPKRLGVVEINSFNKDELETIANKFPILKDVMNNIQIQELLTIPKYIDFILSSLNKDSNDFSTISLKNLKEYLWNHLIKNVTYRHDGMPIKRESVFENIAIKRARRMELFVKPDNADATAIEMLENDGIIIQEENTGRYTPAHDILEDWALVRFIESKTAEYNSANIKDIISNLGNEPAIRRAFRLWIEEKLSEENTDMVIKFIRIVINEPNIERYWADELLIAVFRSKNCKPFFTYFETDLLVNGASFLARCIHLIRVACKENILSGENFLYALPLGSPWTEILLFIEQHIAKTDNIRPSIFNLLFDWENKLYYGKELTNDERQSVAKIIEYYFNKIESANTLSKLDKDIRYLSKLTTILYKLADVSKEYISGLISRALEERNSRKNNFYWFYNVIITNCISSIYSGSLPKELPDLVINTAWHEWKKDVEPDKMFIRRYSMLNHDDCWGLKNENNYFPAGIYKTPILNLLYANLPKGLKLVVDLLNYAVDFYAKTNFEYKHEIIQIEIKLNDGSTVPEWAGEELWLAYRGLSVTHNLVESLLMGLEEYLLKLANSNNESRKEVIKFTFDYIYHHSNNVMPISVLSSVSMAYPELVEEEILPLLRIKEFYFWDLKRVGQEISPLAIRDEEIPFAQEERHRSNQLPHRKKYVRGLLDFVVSYQFNICVLNKQIHEIFDELKNKLDNTDMQWKKFLVDIDARNYKIKGYDDKLKGYPLEVSYDENISEYIDSEKPSIDNFSNMITYSNIINKAYKNTDPISIKKWNELYNIYLDKTRDDAFQDRPITLSAIGLRDFSTVLNSEQLDWSINIIIEAVWITIISEKTHNFIIPINPLEKDVILSSFSNIFAVIADNNDKNELITMIILLVSSLSNNHDVNIIIESLRESFFNKYPDIAKSLWIGLINFSKYLIQNKKRYYDSSITLEKIIEDDYDFIKSNLILNDGSLSIPEISFETHEAFIIQRALAMLPVVCHEDMYLEFTLHTIPLFLNDLDRNHDEMNMSLLESTYLESYLARVLLGTTSNNAYKVLELLLTPFLTMNSNKSQYSYKRNESYHFVEIALEFVVLQFLDEGNINMETEKYKKYANNFWFLWGKLFELINSNDAKPFSKLLFLNIEYLLYGYGRNTGKRNHIDFIDLKNHKEFFLDLISKNGENNLALIIDVFSTIGMNIFLPDGINIIVEICRNEPSDIKALSTENAIYMMRKVFYNFVNKIKKNKILLENFIWILDKMIDLGSSDAYFIRENTITYSKK
ncbi:hypothetical protein FACS1894151_02110 [Spirochaetia bacterium]|nr:hypothetical protein FACS1894151_02110 [Spirochaetia bacterium]